jgi:glycosyltransferase involved in cell wall biosynthesis
LEVEKGVSTLISAAKRLSEDVFFLFVGDGSFRTNAESHLADEIDAGRVEFTGWVTHDEVPAKLNQLKLLVMPSEPTEGLPTIILEALACGTPVYATPVS